MDLNEVAIFTRVVETQSFTAAARALGLPKSSVSRHIAGLEEALGVRLLQRTTRTLNLTEAGAAYYERVSRALSELGEANAAARELQGEPKGTVRLTAPPDTGFLAGIVVRFVRRHPGIRVEVVLAGRRVDLVAEGFDLALRAGRLDDSSLIARRLGQVDHRLFATPRYLERRGMPARLSKLSEHDCVLFRPTGGKNQWQLQGPSGVETVEVTGPIGGDEFSFLRKVVLGGTGIGLLPSFLCARDVAKGKLARLLPEYALRGVGLHLVYPSSRYLPQRVALLRDFILQSLSPPPWDES
jgi:DNA-binding transcriptional LysR family regulator